MPPGPVSCIGGTKYPHCIVLYCKTLSISLKHSSLSKYNSAIHRHDGNRKHVGKTEVIISNQIFNVA